jgi:hypothetical protein
VSRGVVHSVGEAFADGVASMLGGYDAGGQRWGWRTVLRQPREDKT